MTRISFLWIALLPIILSLAFNPQLKYNILPPEQGAFEEISNSAGLIASSSTPTPTSLQIDGTSTPPPPTPARQRDPGLVAGAIIIALIIIVGVLRYSRRR